MNVCVKGKVEKYYADKMEKQGAMLFSLIDPDKTYLEKGVAVAKASAENGADVILIGGSIGAQGATLDDTTKMIKEEVDVPVVLFPGNISGLSPYADAVYFMYMLNSRDVYWLSTAQIQAAPVIAKMRLEAIPTSYVREVSKACNNELFYFYAGGVRNPDQAAQIIANGAHGIQVGTAFEEGKISEKISQMAEAIRKEGKKRV